MCGIAGIVRFEQDGVNVDEIVRLTNLIRHRGPDAVGKWTSRDASVALGHARLSILDLSENAGQPMVDRSGRYVIVFNGEVYNFVEIAEELKKHGYVFRTESDTEVILAAYDRWGAEMTHRFNGMWAMAIYDTVTHRLWLSRDRFGIKPLYYYHSRGCFIFASEVQAIHKCFPQRVTPNWEFLGRMLEYDQSAFGEEASYLTEIKPVRPGFNLLVEPDGRLQTDQWYFLRQVETPRTFQEQAAVLRELLEDACHLRLRSDVPVATCLSGGIDSGSIVSILAQHKTAKQERFSKFTHRSFTASFPGTSLDETASAQALGQAKGMDVETLVVECPTPSELESALEACDGPMPALAFFPIWRLYKHIKECGISVTLDGQGADEMLGGYYLGSAALRGAWQMRRPLWFYDLQGTYGQIHPDASQWIRNDRRHVLRLGGAEIDQALKRPLKAVLTKLGLYAPKPSKLLQMSTPPIWVSADHSGQGNALALGLWQQFFSNPLPFLLHQYDRCSMANGVECRMPFMDHRLVEYVFSLPLSSRIGGGFTKRVLREAVKGILPDAIRSNRLKTGFNAPFEEWMCGPLREWVQDTAATRAFQEIPIEDASRLSDDIALSVATNSSDLNERRVWAQLHIASWLAKATRFSQHTSLVNA